MEPAQMRHERTAMVVGKVPPDLLRRLVFSHLPTRPEVLVSAGIGRDSAVLDVAPHACVVTIDPITGAGAHLGRLAVHVACNDVAAMGADPVALLLALLLPAGTGEEELEAIMREAGAVAGRLGVAIAGGHSEVTTRVTHPVAIVAAIGRAPRDGVLRPDAVRPGHGLLLTKGAGLEGTAILASDLADRLRERVPEPVLARARSFVEELSVLPESRVAAAHGAVAMHDVTEGGVLAAAWEFAEAAGLGVEVWAERVPVREETVAVCRALDADPLALIGSGALLVATSAPDQTLAALRRAGIEAAEIGVFRARERVLYRGGCIGPLEPPARDELWRLLGDP